MILNYFKTAYRNLIRHKGYAIINVAGLAIGIAACLLLFLVVRYELSYDKFRPNYDNIYHIYTQDTYSDGIDYTPGIPFPALEALRADLPNIKIGAFCSTFGNQITIGQGSQNKKFVEDHGVYFADPEYFDILQAKWLVGNATVLSQPNAVVLSKSTALKYYNDWKTVVGKTLRLDNAIDFRIAGIIEDAPYNSDFRMNVIGSFITIKNAKMYNYQDDWGSTTSNFQIYMLFPENVTEDAIEKQLVGLSKKYYKNEGKNLRLNLLRPLKEIHYDTNIGNTGTHVMARSTLTTLSLIGFLIILMACINFINLSTAQAVGRSKEVGIRKVLGSNRHQLFWQMIVETKFIVLIAALISLVLAWLALPYIKHVVSIEEDLSLFNLQTFLFFILSIILVTLLAGIYPSFILSGFTPIIALRNKITSATVGGISLRRTLVVIQFAISQVLIIGVIVAISQMNYVRNADLGFNKDALLLLGGNTDSTTLKNQPAFKEALAKIPGVTEISFASDMPSSDSNQGTNFAVDHKPDENFTLYLKFGDEDYFKTFGLQFLAGKAYAKSDTISTVVVNETLLRKLNIASPEQALGKDLRIGGGKWKSICGVVKDFKTNSLREEVKPIMISSKRNRYQLTCIKLQTQNMLKTQREIQDTWDKFFPDYVYDGSFMDETIENFYQQESQMALLYKIFAGLAIFISCLGLYGLISFMVVQKTKEVGIRKVLGASIPSILILFSKEFAVLIGVAFVIAAPLAWLVMSKWLNNFVYHIQMNAGIYVVAMLTSLCVAFLAVSYKAIKAAIVNPVKSLRSE
ncbi:ABC transporter permease [Sphingobacteriaceae bacterium]|nr:ABC transporter permease [Sphingobacteriaceae bacterium]